MSMSNDNTSERSIEKTQATSTVLDLGGLLGLNGGDVLERL